MSRRFRIREGEPCTSIHAAANPDKPAFVFQHEAPLHLSGPGGGSTGPLTCSGPWDWGHDRRYHDGEPSGLRPSCRARGSPPASAIACRKKRPHRRGLRREGIHHDPCTARSLASDHRLGADVRRSCSTDNDASRGGARGCRASMRRSPTKPKAPTCSTRPEPPDGRRA